MTDQPRFELAFATEPEVVKRFASEEELQAFRAYERKCTVHQFQRYCKAHAPEERRLARIALAKAQLAAYARWKELRAHSFRVGGPKVIA